MMTSMASAEYDPESNAVYVTLTENAVASSREISESVVADLDCQGEIVGLEILDPRPGLETLGWVPSRLDLLSQWGEIVSAVREAMRPCTTASIAQATFQTIAPTNGGVAADASVAAGTVSAGASFYFDAPSAKELV